MKIYTVLSIALLISGVMDAGTKKFTNYSGTTGSGGGTLGSTMKVTLVPESGKAVTIAIEPGKSGTINYSGKNAKSVTVTDQEGNQLTSIDQSDLMTGSGGGTELLISKDNFDIKVTAGGVRLQ